MRIMLKFWNESVLGMGRFWGGVNGLMFLCVLEFGSRWWSPYGWKYASRYWYDGRKNKIRKRGDLNGITETSKY
jgi:hypothetical protein